MSRRATVYQGASQTTQGMGIRRVRPGAHGVPWGHSVSSVSQSSGATARVHMQRLHA